VFKQIPNARSVPPRSTTTGHAAMPSFLSKVFGHKKGDEKESTTTRSVKRISDPSLLEGKFEAISLSTPKFSEDVHASNDRESDKAGVFGLTRPKPKSQLSSPITNAPHLTLRLPGLIDRNGDSLVPSFNSQANESDDSISMRRLTPAETLLLIEACSKAITERGGECVRFFAFHLVRGTECARIGLETL